MTHALHPVVVRNVEEAAGHGGHIGLVGVEGDPGCAFRILQVCVHIDAGVADRAEGFLQHVSQLAGLDLARNGADEDLTVDSRSDVPIHLYCLKSLNYRTVFRGFRNL
jgi:hypothetical protein